MSLFHTSRIFHFSAKDSKVLVIVITECPGTPISNITSLVQCLSVIESDVSPSLTRIKRSFVNLGDVFMVF